jgi:hypothetical protein
MRATRFLLFGAGCSAVIAATFASAGNDHARATGTLVRGWNNVSYQGAARPPSEALAPITGQFTAVYRWNAVTQTYELYGPSVPDYATTLTQLNPGDAIWLYMTTESAAQLGGGSAPSPGSNTGTRHVAVPASAFLPANDLAIYEKTFNQLNPVGADLDSVRYYAPVTLPDGATVTSMTATYEVSGGVVDVRFDYTPLANGTTANQVYKLVEVISTSGASPQTAQAFSHVVDNGANVYFLVVDLAGGAGSRLHGVSLAYTGG